MLRHTFYVVAAECCIAHVERIWIVEPYIVIVNEACADSQVRHRTIVRREGPKHVQCDGGEATPAVSTTVIGPTATGWGRGGGGRRGPHTPCSGDHAACDRPTDPIPPTGTVSGDTANPPKERAFTCLQHGSGRGGENQRPHETVERPLQRTRE